MRTSAAFGGSGTRSASRNSRRAPESIENGPNVYVAVTGEQLHILPQSYLACAPEPAGLNHRKNRHRLGLWNAGAFNDLLEAGIAAQAGEGGLYFDVNRPGVALLDGLFEPR